MKLFGKKVTNIVIPFNKDQLQFLLQNSDDWQVALIDFWGQIFFHLSSSPHLLFFFLKTHPVIFPKKFSIQPLEGTILVFTDDSSNGKAVTIIDKISHVQVTEETSAQKAELRAVIWVFQHLRDHTFNLLTDSRYIVGLFPHIETANIPENKLLSSPCYLIYRKRLNTEIKNILWDILDPILACLALYMKEMLWQMH